MLFNSTVSTVFNQMENQLYNAETQARKADAQKRICFYEDNQLSYIETELSKYFSEVDKLKICFINIVKKITNNLAMVYIQDANREVEGTDQDQEIFKEIFESTALSVKWKTINRYTKLLKTLCVRPIWRKGKMDLDILTPDILDVSTDLSPEDLQSVMVTHYPESGKQEEIYFSLWDDLEFKRLNYRGQVIESEPNPYGTIPYIPIWDRCPISSFWLSGGDDLIIIQESISEKLTDLLYTIRHQGFSTGYIKQGSQSGGSIQADPGSLIQLGENGEVGYVSAQAPISEIIEAIEFLLAQASVSNGLSASSLSTKNIDESGIAKIAGNRELEELRRLDIQLFNTYEHRLFEMFKTVWNVHNPNRKISEKAILKIDFYDPKPQVDPKSQAQMWDLEMSMGVISPVDIAMEKNPDLKTREDALAHLLLIKDELKELNE